MLHVAQIVHEACHAMFDIAGVPMSVRQSEAAAYIAQMLFLYHCNPEASAGLGATPFTDDILNKAWQVSAAGRGGPTAFAEAHVEPLFQAIAAHSEYEHKVGAEVPYNGL